MSEKNKKPNESGIPTLKTPLPKKYRNWTLAITALGFLVLGGGISIGTYFDLPKEGDGSWVTALLFFGTVFGCVALFFIAAVRFGRYSNSYDQMKVWMEFGFDQESFPTLPQTLQAAGRSFTDVLRQRMMYIAALCLVQGAIEEEVNSREKSLQKYGEANPISDVAGVKDFESSYWNSAGEIRTLRLVHEKITEEIRVQRQTVARAYALFLNNWQLGQFADDMNGKNWSTLINEYKSKGLPECACQSHRAKEVVDFVRDAGEAVKSKLDIEPVLIKFFQVKT
jgi:hypothetical protein